MLTDEYQLEEARAQLQKQVETYKSQLPKELVEKYYEGLISDTHVEQHLNIIKRAKKIPE